MSTSNVDPVSATPGGIQLIGQAASLILALINKYNELKEDYPTLVELSKGTTLLVASLPQKSLATDKYLKSIAKMLMSLVRQLEEKINAVYNEEKKPKMRNVFITKHSLRKLVDRIASWTEMLSKYLENRSVLSSLWVGNIIRHDDAYAFWCTNFGSDVNSIDTEQFIKALCLHYDNCFLKYIRPMIEVYGDGNISAHEFSAFVKKFGFDNTLEHAIIQALKLLNEDWFHPMSKTKKKRKPRNS